LGVILEKVSGKTYEQMVMDVICTPLGMTNTTQELSERQKKMMVKVYNEAGTETPAWDFQAMAAAGALRSSVYDLLVYSRAYIAEDDKPLGKAMRTTQEVSFNDGMTVGLGWHIKMEGGGNIYLHTGGTYGSSSFLAFDPDKKIAVVVLSNAAASVDETGTRLLTLLQQTAER
jgi:CubicO group peptidase (beta-lactamase class C family)